MRKIYFKNTSEWRKWLKKNHEKEKAVNLIKYKKHTGKPSLTSKEAMHEAICFGWIDTTINRIDKNRYSQKFVKRNKNGRWSANTISYARKLIREERMTPTGLKSFKEGFKKYKISKNK